jgi:hypothetical protein
VIAQPKICYQQLGRNFCRDGGIQQVAEGVKIFMQRVHFHLYIKKIFVCVVWSVCFSELNSRVVMGVTLDVTFFFSAFCFSVRVLLKADFANIVKESLNAYS